MGRGAGVENIRKIIQFRLSVCLLFIRALLIFLGDSPFVKRLFYQLPFETFPNTNDLLRSPPVPAWRRVHDLLTKSELPSAPLMHGTRPPSFAELSDAELMAHLQAGCNHALAILFLHF